MTLREGNFGDRRHNLEIRPLGTGISIPKSS
jgi:hypothetical protein